MDLSIVIPAYDEEGRIGRTLERYATAFPDAEFIVVLNGCRDRTIDVVQSSERRFPGLIRHLDIPNAVGKGRAVREGFRLSQGLAVGFVDADGATSPDEFRKLRTALERAEGAIASRWFPGSTVINRTWLRTLASRTFQIAVGLLFRMPYRDTQCGAKLFRREVMNALLPQLRIDNMAFDVELLYLARRSGFRIVEIPTVWEDQSRSAVLGSPFKLILNGFRMLSVLLGLRWRRSRPVETERSQSSSPLL